MSVVFVIVGVKTLPLLNKMDHYDCVETTMSACLKRSQIGDAFWQPCAVFVRKFLFLSYLMCFVLATQNYSQPETYVREPTYTPTCSMIDVACLIGRVPVDHSDVQT